MSHPAPKKFVEGFTLNRVPMTGEEAEFIEGFRFRSREGFTTNRVQVSEDEEFIEGFTFGRTMGPATSRYATYRSLDRKSVV